MNMARPEVPIAAALRVAPSMSMSPRTTSAPAVAKARAIAFPRPVAEPAPVTNATLPTSVTDDILCVASRQSHKPEFDVGGPDPRFTSDPLRPTNSFQIQSRIYGFPT